MADVDAELGEVEAARSHKEVDREQLLRKQVGRWGLQGGGLIGLAGSRFPPQTI